MHHLRSVAEKPEQRGRRDPRDVPAYSITEAASLVGVPRATLRSWVLGRDYPTRAGSRRFPPVIALPDASRPFLSFTNLVEAHVLASMRREHELGLDRIRSAIGYVRKELRVERPLAHERFRTNGVDLFVDRLGRLVNASARGQLEMREMIDAHLRRVEYAQGRAVAFFPLFRGADSPESIEIDARKAFGRPVLRGTSIPVSAIRQRFDAGESVASLAEDFGVDVSLIEEALRATPKAA